MQEMYAINLYFTIVQMGHPYLIIVFGGGDSWKTGIALDEESEDGRRIGDELEMVMF